MAIEAAVGAVVSWIGQAQAALRFYTETEADAYLLEMAHAAHQTSPLISIAEYQRLIPMTGEWAPFRETLVNACEEKALRDAVDDGVKVRLCTIQKILPDDLGVSSNSSVDTLPCLAPRIDFRLVSMRDIVL